MSPGNILAGGIESCATGGRSTTVTSKFSEADSPSGSVAVTVATDVPADTAVMVTVAPDTATAAMVGAEDSQ